MSVRLNLALSDELNREVDRVVKENETTKSEVFRKALQLYLAASDGKREGLKLVLMDPQQKKMSTEIIGL
jgi:metal-responsive CopG/Arc/MetJ family transcriptional regulator